MSILSSKTADCCLQRRLFYTIPPCPRGYSLVPKARRRRSTHAHVSGQAGLQCLLRCDWLRGIHPNVVLLYPASNMICGARIVCAPTSVAHCGLSSPPPLHLQLFSLPFSPPPPPPASSSPPLPPPPPYSRIGVGSDKQCSDDGRRAGAEAEACVPRSPGSIGHARTH